MPGGMANPTIQLNKMRNTDPKRRAAGAPGPLKRGMQLGRFGGYGNQRYPVGFSGDVAGLTWANLAYQPYFTMTASNAGGFSYWSHDITVRRRTTRVRRAPSPCCWPPRAAPPFAAVASASARCQELPPRTPFRRAPGAITRCTRGGSRGAPFPP